MAAPTVQDGISAAPPPGPDRQLRVITDVAELDALPVSSVVMDEFHGVLQT